MTDSLLGSDTVDEYRRAVSQGAERVAARLRRTDAPFSGAEPGDLEAAIAGIDLDAPLADTAAALDELERVYLRDAVYFHHPRYLAHLNCPVAIPALLAETILAPINSSLDTWDQSGGATLIEQRLIEWAARRIGLPDTADGVFTSGGTQSNLQALLIAREERPDAHHILVSEAGHFSVAKAAKLLGLPDDAVVDVPCDERRRMDPEALRDALARTQPLAVVATAGTTDFGSIDPLPAIADACAATWLHVDAAYGCGLLVSPTRRQLLAGLERADSATVDFHKAFFQPISSSAVLVRDGATLRHATHHADYLNPEQAGVPNHVDKSLQTTRRFDALKLWLTLRIMGADHLGELFDRVVDLAADAYALLRDDPRYEVIAPPELSTLVFRLAGATDAAQLEAREALLADGTAVVASTRADGRQWLKFTLLNPATTLDDVAAVLDALVPLEVAA